MDLFGNRLNTIPLHTTSDLRSPQIALISGSSFGRLLESQVAVECHYTNYNSERSIEAGSKAARKYLEANNDIVD